MLLGILRVLFQKRNLYKLCSVPVASASSQTHQILIYLEHIYHTCLCLPKSRAKRRGRPGPILGLKVAYKRHCSICYTYLGLLSVPGILGLMPQHHWTLLMLSQAQYTDHFVLCTSILASHNAVSFPWWHSSDVLNHSFYHSLSHHVGWEPHWYICSVVVFWGRLL